MWRPYWNLPVFFLVASEDELESEEEVFFTPPTVFFPFFVALIELFFLEDLESLDDFLVSASELEDEEVETSFSSLLGFL